MRRSHEREWIADRCEDALMYDGLDAAVVGVAHRCAQPTLVVYDGDRIVRVLTKRDGMTDDEAREWIAHNIVGGWCGPNTPLVLERLERRSRRRPRGSDAEVERLRRALERIAENKDEPLARDFAVEVLDQGFTL